MIKKTIISHFYNEEYLLPWWLNHHKQFFDHGIMVNYNSNDNSVNIIKQICPTWEIINSRNTFFDAKLVDDEISDIEKSIDGWRICLNTTEFLIGNYFELENLNFQRYTIPSFVMVDTDYLNIPNYDKSLIEQKKFGIPYKNNFLMRRARLLHTSKEISYPLGRHFEEYNTEKFVILWYGWCPFNDFVINRKLQIQNKIPDSDKNRGFGGQHIVTREELYNEFNKMLNLTKDLTKELENYL